MDHTWNLADLFADDADWRVSRDAVLQRLDEVREVAGTLGRSAADLARALEIISDLSESSTRLRAYASMRADGDTRIAEGQALRSEAEMLWTDLSRAAAFVRPEILAVDPDRLRGFIDEEPALAAHRHFLEDLLRIRPHVLGPAEERILAEASLLHGGSYAVFSLLHNSDLPRPEIVLDDGTRVRATPAEFMRRRTSPRRDERRRVFEAYFGAYADFRSTLGQNLFQTIKTHVFHARSRGFDGCLAAALHGENIPASVYHNLIRRVHDALPLLHRYLRLRAGALGLPGLAYHDLHCPIGSAAPGDYPVDRAIDLMRETMAPLGGAYVTDLERAFQQRWIDWRPRDGKKAGAYASGPYGVHPYVLLNFQEDLDSVSTLAHELGHAMHSFYSNRTQPYPTADYSIFVAEVASTFNEALLNSALLERAREPSERLPLLAGYLDGVRGTLFRQAMFAEFELEIHEAAERGEALTGEWLDRAYLRLLRVHHGHDAGVVEVDDAYAIEWAAVPHFHYDFYVYQYATGIVAATALAERVLAEKPKSRRRYLEFLSAGGSDYPLSLLRRAGVDLETSEPYEVAFEAFGRRLDQLEELLAAPPATG